MVVSLELRSNAIREMHVAFTFVTTTYAVSMSAVSWTDVTRRHVVDLVEAWADELPRAGNAHLRYRRGHRDPVFRVQYTETFRSEGLVRLTAVTVLPLRGALTVEARVEEVGTRGLVEPPRSGPRLPDHGLIDLIGHAASSLTAYDAERRIVAAAQVVSGFVAGQTLAALLTAPSRRLPVVIESVVGRATGAERTAGLGTSLVGIAHVAHLTDAEAIDGLNDLYGDDLGAASYPLIVWPRSQERLVLSAQARPSDVLAPILAAAVAAPPLVLPPPPRETRGEVVQRPAPPVPPRAAVSPTPPIHDVSLPVEPSAELLDTIDRLRAQHDEDRLHIDTLDEILEQVESERDELRDRVEERDDELDRLRQLNSKLVARNVEYELERESQPTPIVIDTIADAVRVAMSRSSALEFAPEALDTASRLEGPDPKMLLRDLAKLDGVVMDWRNNKVSLAGLESWATGTAGLDYVPTIGEDTAHRHADYYFATWNGRIVPLRAHLRRGKFARMIRVYLHVDPATKTIVVGKIDRHGPDSTT